MSTPWSERWVRRFGTTKEGLFVSDDRGRIKYWSEGAERLVGYPKEEVLGKRCYSVLCGRRGGKPWCQPDCAVRRTVRRGARPAHVVVDLRARNGSRISIALAFLVRQERKKYVVAHLLLDATRENRLRRALDDMRRLLHGIETDEAAIPVWDDTPALCFGSCIGGADLSVLSRRETDALRCLTCGMTTEEIARQLGVSPLTARNHVQHTLKARPPPPHAGRRRRDRAGPPLEPPAARKARSRASRPDAARASSARTSQ